MKVYLLFLESQGDFRPVAAFESYKDALCGRVSDIEHRATFDLLVPKVGEYIIEAVDVTPERKDEH